MVVSEQYPNLKANQAFADLRVSWKAPRTASPWRATATSRRSRSTTCWRAAFPSNLTAMVFSYSPKPTVSRRQRGADFNAADGRFQQEVRHAPSASRHGGFRPSGRGLTCARSAAGSCDGCWLLALCHGRRPAQAVPVPAAERPGDRHHRHAGRRPEDRHWRAAGRFGGDQGVAGGGADLVPSTATGRHCQYANRVANTWKVGRRAVGDGVLLIVAKNDRSCASKWPRPWKGPCPTWPPNASSTGHHARDFAGRLCRRPERRRRAMAALISGEALPEPCATTRTRHRAAGFPVVRPADLHGVCRADRCCGGTQCVRAASSAL
jgi:hypothetical protein